MFTRSILLFALAGLCEIGGGYLVWLWLRDHRSVVFGVLGGLILFLYGVLPTLQPSHFGRVYAAYGGVFVVLSLLWGWWVDGHRPDVPDVIGGLVCLAGVGVIMYWPRTAKAHLVVASTARALGVLPARVGPSRAVSRSLRALERRA